MLLKNNLDLSQQQISIYSVPNVSSRIALALCQGMPAGAEREPQIKAQQETRFIQRTL